VLRMMVNACIKLNIIVSISARRESSKAVATRLKFSNMVQDQSKSEKASVKEKECRPAPPPLPLACFGLSFASGAPLGVDSCGEPEAGKAESQMCFWPRRPQLEEKRHSE
jgi:hypothetical protein